MRGGDGGAAARATDADAPARQARRPGAATGAADHAPSPIDADPGALLGLDPSGLRARLGEPAQIRREQPARIWQYRARGCVLDLFLYPESAGLAVVHLEARDDAAEPMPGRACLERLLRNRG